MNNLNYKMINGGYDYYTTCKYGPFNVIGTRNIGDNTYVLIKFTNEFIKNEYARHYLIPMDHFSNEEIFGKIVDIEFNPIKINDIFTIQTIDNELYRKYEAKNTYGMIILGKSKENILDDLNPKYLEHNHKYTTTKFTTGFINDHVRTDSINTGEIYSGKIRDNTNLPKDFIGRAHRKIYDGIKNRCYKSTNKNFCNYGAIGVRMCDSWRDNINIFINELSSIAGHDRWLNDYLNYDLDKDALQFHIPRGNRIYAPNTVLFLHKRLNSHLSSRNAEVYRYNNDEIIQIYDSIDNYSEYYAHPYCCKDTYGNLIHDKAIGPFSNYYDACGALNTYHYKLDQYNLLHNNYNVMCELIKPEMCIYSTPIEMCYNVPINIETLYERRTNPNAKNTYKPIK